MFKAKLVHISLKGSLSLASPTEFSKYPKLLLNLGQSPTNVYAIIQNQFQKMRDFHMKKETIF